MTTHTEKQQAKAAIYKHEANDEKAVLGSHKERKSGKRVVIAGHTIIFTQETLQKDLMRSIIQKLKEMGRKGKLAPSQLIAHQRIRRPTFI